MKVGQTGNRDKDGILHLAADKSNAAAKCGAVLFTFFPYIPGHAYGTPGHDWCPKCGEIVGLAVPERK